MTSVQTVLLIGASRGLGFALAEEWLSRGWDVIPTVRGSDTLLHGLQQQYGTRLRIEKLDVTSSADIKKLADGLSGKVLDTLYVNAGAALGPGDRLDEITTEDFNRLMVINALSPMRVIESLSPSVNEKGTIAVMSSSLGSVALNENGGWEVYRASKAALNMLMRSYAARQSVKSRTLALVDPGWVRTEMGGSDASLSAEESIPGIVDQLAKIQGIRGLHFFNYKGETLPW